MAYIAKDDFTSFFSPHMGGAQRLPTGNTLICEGNKGCLFEVTPDGDVVREFVSPHFVNSASLAKSTGCFGAAGMPQTHKRSRRLHGQFPFRSNIVAFGAISEVLTS